LFVFAQPQGHALEDAIVAIVNDDLITLKNLRDYLHSRYVQLRLEGKEEKEIQGIMAQLEKDGINQLIQDKLILTEANNVGLEVREEIINQRLNQIKERYKSEQEFYDALLSDGSTVTDLRNKIKDQLKVKYLVEEEVNAKIYVNPQEVTEYYKNHFEEFMKSERVSVNSIYISNSNDPKLAKEKAIQAYRMLKKLHQEGGNFEDIAKEFSEAPSIGTITKGEMMPIIEDVVFKLEINEISPVVAVEDGFYLFQVKNKYPAELATLEEVKDKISETLFQKKFKQRFDTWIGKLKKNAFIDIK
jgi:parvulin-like peptidyl-prolyl isomerase